MRTIHGTTLNTSPLYLPKGTFVTLVSRRRFNTDQFIVGRVANLTKSGSSLWIEQRTITETGEVTYAAFSCVNHYGNTISKSGLTIDIVFSSESECNAYVETKQLEHEERVHKQRVHQLALTAKHRALGQEIQRQIQLGNYQVINFDGTLLYVVPVMLSKGRMVGTRSEKTLYIVSIHDYAAHPNPYSHTGFSVSACRVSKELETEEIQFSLLQSYRDEELDVALGEALEP